MCEELLRQVRQQMATSNGAAPAGKLERGVAPGSFLHHLATAKHHVSVRNGDDFTDTEILQQVCVLLTGLDPVLEYIFCQLTLPYLHHLKLIISDIVNLKEVVHMYVREVSVEW